MDTTIRNLDARLYRALLARAKAQKRTVGSLANEAFRSFLKPKPTGKGGRSIFDLAATDLGPGSERLSEQIDQILYGEDDRI